MFGSVWKCLEMFREFTIGFIYIMFGQFSTDKCCPEFFPKVG